MAYFVTGGTGFIGRRFVVELAAHVPRIYVLVRPGSAGRFEQLRAACGALAPRLEAVEGDLEQPYLGLDAAVRARLRGTVRHFVHLGALYDLAAKAEDVARINVAGTGQALALAQDLEAGCFHFMSSIAAAGRYPGVFTEAMFEEATGLEHAYFRSKHAGEALVRQSARMPWRIYRPGMVVGDSETGAMDKIDGPYYLFKAIQRVRDALPNWFPLLGFEGGYVNIVPVDFVARALAHLVRLEGLDGQCFHLTDPKDRRVGEVLNLFARAAHAPTLTVRLGIPLMPTLRLESLSTPLRGVLKRLLEELSIPEAVLGMLDLPTRFDASRTQALLHAAGIEVPALEAYAWRLWDYWERRLDRDELDAHTLRARLSGKTVLITGGSSGIGRATALKLAEAGLQLLIVGRNPEKLAATVREIEERGGRARAYACDLADAAASERLLGELLGEHARIDVLINNAGRSIRRGIDHTYQRFHDYERLMQINYFAAVRMTLGLLPRMVAQGGGHVLCISSIGAITHAARFASYNASKAALEAFSRCAAAEYRDRHVLFTVINMPLVRTPMVAPTRLYDHADLLKPEQAADIVCAALIRRPLRVVTGLGRLAQLAEALMPWLNTAVMTENFRLYGESEATPTGAAAAPGMAATAATPSKPGSSAAGPEACGAASAGQAARDAAALGSLLRHVHW